MYTISKLSREYGLSRSTLLYYDRIGLLKPSARTDSEYRNYSDKDRNRLGVICTFREAGVPLEQIKALLDSEGREEEEGRVLEKRLSDINREIRYLRLQQSVIVEMLKVKPAAGKPAVLDKDLLMSMFDAAGMKEEMLDRFHSAFEKNMPEVHQFFLEFLGIPTEQIMQIRKHSGGK